MTDFSKIIDKAKELEAKMKESQEKIKNIKVEGVSGSNSVKVILDGEGEMQSIQISDDILKEEKSIIVLIKLVSILVHQLDSKKNTLIELKIQKKFH